MTHARENTGGLVEELLQFLYLMPVATLKLGPAGEVELINPRAVQLLESLDVDSGTPSGLTILDALAPGLAHAWAASRGRIGEVAPPWRGSVARGGAAPLHLVLRLLRPDDRCTMVVIEDVTATVARERELHRSRQQLAFVLEKLEGYCVAMLDPKGRLVDTNPSIARMFGAVAGGRAGAPVHELLRAPDGSDGVPPFTVIEDVVRRQGVLRREAPLRAADDAVIWGDVVLTPTVDAEGATTGYVVVIRDISEQHDAWERLTREALTDPLTGLLNRRGFERRVAQLAGAPAHVDPLASWVLLDVDHFKRVNDTHGHDGGDEVLRQVATLLRALARESDVLARLGGEEFVVVLPGAPAEAALGAAERLRAGVERSTIMVGAERVRVTASFGVATQPRALASSAVLAAADTALYAAKAAGRNRVVAAPPAPRAAVPDSAAASAEADG